MKVLVVDDAAANRLVLTALLKRAGHEAVSAGSVEEALIRLREDSPDAVVTDLHMAGADDGVVLARRIRSLPTAGRVRLALMTGDAAAYGNGDRLFDVILDKPVLSSELFSFLKGASA